MAENASNVYVASPKAGGAVWSAPLGTAIPTDASTALGSDFKCLGYISEDGISHETESDTEDIKAYGGKTVKTVQTGYKESYKFTPIETNAEVLAVTWGDDNVTVGTGGSITVARGGNQRPPRVYVIETVLDDGMIQRDVVPRGRVTEVGEQKFASKDALASEITVSCEPDASGKYSYTYVASTLRDLANATIANIPDQTHTGSPITPTLSVMYGTDTLVLGTDYTVAYADNTDVGTATATITAKAGSDYTGTKSKTFEIVSA